LIISFAILWHYCTSLKLKTLGKLPESLRQALAESFMTLFSFEQCAQKIVLLSRHVEKAAAAPATG
jgi:hypothetical protein